jgi:hypothetical protein
MLHSGLFGVGPLQAASSVSRSPSATLSSSALSVNNLLAFTILAVIRACWSLFLRPKYFPCLKVRAASPSRRSCVPPSPEASIALVIRAFLCSAVRCSARSACCNTSSWGSAQLYLPARRCWRTGRFVLPLGPPRQRSFSPHLSHTFRGKPKSLTGRYTTRRGPCGSRLWSLPPDTSRSLRPPWPKGRSRTHPCAEVFWKCFVSLSCLILATTSTPNSLKAPREHHRCRRPRRTKVLFLAKVQRTLAGV